MSSKSALKTSSQPASLSPVVVAGALSSSSSSLTATTLVDFVSAVPPPLVAELVTLSPYIHIVRRVLEIASWRSGWEEGWLALAAWWALCLLSESMLRYFLPLGILFILAVKQWTASAHTSAPPPITERNLQTTLGDLTIIRDLLPLPALPPSIPPTGVLLRICLTLYPIYLIFTYFVPLRVSLGLVGTALLLHRARWAQYIRSSFTRSAFIRWTSYRLYSLVSGVPPPARIAPPAPHPLANSPGSGSAATLIQPSQNLRFLFTIYENQRWWMGLDWTAALLPGERPSWCSASLAPIAPPVAFSLPSPSTAYVSDGKGGRVRRLARWTWEESEWRVVVKREGQDGIRRVEKPLPKDTGEEAESAASKLLRAASTRRRDSMSGAVESPERTEKGKEKEEERHGDEPTNGPMEEELYTDADGWVYGGNKWEGPSSKGGIGKYTRYRRWTRIAVLSETIESVQPGELGVVRGASQVDEEHNSMMSPTSPVSTTQSMSIISDREDSSMKEPKDGPGWSRGRSLLRQRLKAVVDGSTPSS